MSTDRETTRIVRSWLEEGVTQLPDRVLDAVLDQVPAIPQRRATWWPARRLSTMNTTIKFGLAAVVVAVAALVGINYLGTANVGGPGVESSTPTLEPNPTPEPSVAEPSSPPAGLLPEGPHVLSDGEAPEGGQTSLPLTVTIPAPGWYGEPGGGILQKNDNSDAPDGSGMIVFFGELYVYGDPCEWSTTRPDTPATTVDELVAALAAQASRDASEPEDITLDGYPGKSITLHVPEDAVFGECDRGTFGSWGVPGPDVAPHRYHQDPGQIDEIWIVNVNGELATIDWAYYARTPAEHVEELRSIVDSISFEPP